MGNKIYTATINQPISATSSRNGGQSSTLNPGDMVSVVDDGNGYYYILEYNTTNSNSKNAMDNGTSFVGKYISKSSLTESGSSQNFNKSDTGLETDISKINYGGQPNVSRSGPNDSWTESLNAKYPVTATTVQGQNLSSPKVALDNRRNPYAYDKDKVTKMNEGSYLVNDTDTYVTDLENRITGAPDTLSIQSLIGVIGIPHQFTAVTDPRMISGSDRVQNDQLIGRTYAANIIKTIPLLLVTPGQPHFAAKKTGGDSGGGGSGLGAFMQNITQGFSNIYNISPQLGGGKTEYSGKYYRLEFCYAEYYGYLNVMLRAAAQFLGIGDERFGDIPIASMQWQTYNAGIFATVRSGWMTSVLGSIGNAGGLMGKSQLTDCIAFYANCGETVNDNFGTSITESQLASSLNSMSDTAREYQFVAGGVFNMDLKGGFASADSTVGGINSLIESTFGKNAVSSMLSKAQTLLAGGRLVFPRIWQDSNFDRSYSISMKLVSPTADRLAIFFSILVPLYHVLALVLPKESYEGAQGYIAPFLIRMYYKGKFNVDMGIITACSIVRGAEAEWSKDGLPSVLEIQMTITDLYNRFFMSNGAQMIFSNITELDYIANTCGININTSEAARAVVLWQNIFAANVVQDYIHNIFYGLQQLVNQGLNNLFGYW